MLLLPPPLLPAADATTNAVERQIFCPCRLKKIPIKKNFREKTSVAVCEKGRKKGKREHLKHAFMERLEFLPKRTSSALLLVKAN